MYRWLLWWSLKGLVLPAILWALLNIGLTWYLQPFMPQIQAARNRGGPWTDVYCRVWGAGWFLISSYWSPTTLAWVLFSAVGSAEPEARKDFKRLCVTSLLGLGIPAILLLLCGGFSTAGFAAMLLLAPVAGYSQDFLQPRKLPPVYARAIARIKLGKYGEAEGEILRQLENWEDDFEGWMMLAELYANHFGSLNEAEHTVLEVCSQPHTTHSQIAIALHRLADWHLKLAKDPDAARRSLLVICDRLKGTHLAHMAQLRINQLPSSKTEMREQQHSRPIPLPALGDQLDEVSEGEPVDRNKATVDANAYVEQLKQNPNNVMAREKLARLLVDRLEKPEMAIEQIELLLEMPDRSDSERAEWLGLVAAWHIKYRQDIPAGRKALERLTGEYPRSVQAFAARRRLEQLAPRLKIDPS